MKCKKKKELNERIYVLHHFTTHLFNYIFLISFHTIMIRMIH